MSAAARLQASVAQALRSDPALAGMAVFDAPPVRAALPHAVVGEPALGDWSAAGVSAREGRIAVAIHDGGSERPVRLRALAAAAEGAVAAMPQGIGEGWRAVQLRLLRSTLARAPGERWIATATFAVRLYREDA